MSYGILNIGKTGMKAMQTKMNGVADDLANVNTYGYKRKNIGFQELLLNEIHENDVLLSGNAGASSINIGAKSGVSTIDYSQGNIQESSGEFHLALEGPGFFGVEDEQGNLLLTRNGGFHLNEDLTITDDNGNHLSMDLNLPIEEWGDDIVINSNGDITRQDEGELVELGKIILYNPDILDSLTPLGEGRYLAAGDVALNNSLMQDTGFGNIIQGALEGSNVEIAQSMSEMITTQRAYSLNAQAIHTTNEIMDMINNIKR